MRCSHLLRNPKFLSWQTKGTVTGIDMMKSSAYGNDALVVDALNGTGESVVS